MPTGCDRRDCEHGYQAECAECILSPETKKRSLSCWAENCANRDDYGCLNDYIEVDKFGSCVCYEPIDEEEK